jgi:DNA gyrase subunit B
MTDADVDGAHIRTLLLTFFYRQMPELVERGHIYIAQPPLYKIKHGKSERYIKDDHELNQHLLGLALDGAELVPQAGAEAIRGEALAELARSYLLAEAVISRLGSFIDSEVLHGLLAHDIAVDLTDELSARASAGRLSAHLPANIRVGARFDDKTERWQLVLEKMLHGNLKTGVIDEEFLISSDYQQIRHTSQQVSGLIGSSAVIRRGEKSQAVKSFAEAMGWLLAEVERGLSKQRYKGLGEMNPEQLWETTMNPETRTLLQVSIEDAAAADRTFDMLMGSAVPPRTRFIVTHAHAVRNLDI